MKRRYYSPYPHIPFFRPSRLTRRTQEHKQKIKDEKREGRKTKMPKYVKKKLVSGKKGK